MCHKITPAVRHSSVIINDERRVAARERYRGQCWRDAPVEMEPARAMGTNNGAVVLKTDRKCFLRENPQNGTVDRWTRAQNVCRAVVKLSKPIVLYCIIVIIL